VCLIVQKTNALQHKLCVFSVALDSIVSQLPPYRQYRCTALVVWPTYCLGEVLCQRSPPLSRGQWGYDPPEGVVQLTREMAAQIPHSPSESLRLDPLAPDSCEELRGKMLAVLRCLSSMPVPNSQATFAMAAPLTLIR
jgi:hypothetical protein